MRPVIHFLILALSMSLAPPAAQAQSPAASSPSEAVRPESVEAFVAPLSDREARQLLIAKLKSEIAGEAADPAAVGREPLIARLRDAMNVFGERLDALGAAVRDLPRAAPRAFDNLINVDGMAGFWRANVFLVAVFAFGFLAARRIRKGFGGAAESSLRGRMQTAAVDAVLVAVFVPLAFGLSFLAFERFDPLREFVTSMVSAGASLWLISIGLGAAVALTPDLAPARPWLLVSAALVSFGYFRSGLMTLIGYEPLHVVALDLALGFLALWPLLWLCGLHARRATVTSAKIVALLTAVYFAAAWCLWAVNLIVDRDDGAYAAVYSLLIVLVVPFADRLLTLGLERWFAVKSGDDAERRSAADHRYWGRMVGRVAFAVAALLALSRAWGFGAGTALDHPIGLAIARSLFNIAVTLALAYVGWELVKHMINRKLAAERPANVGDGEIEGAGSRAHTLLPLLQSFVFIVMSVMVALIVLSSLGIDIGPLLAGAGIVGLAIGFGAQTLVRDVVSGVFFLIDDAFRIGEYVDLGRLRGTVEKISIRSLQLRHHRGAVHTVPFGQIQAITNQTRDWTIDKLELPLTLDADIDKVKKVLKRIGQEMMDNPELKDVLLEPLKSQGVSRMTDYGLIVRAKYKTVPSKQFLVRREAYKRIRDAFAAEGIKFAQPTVKVDGGDTDAAAAARAVLAKAADGA